MLCQKHQYTFVDQTDEGNVNRIIRWCQVCGVLRVEDYTDNRLIQKQLGIPKNLKNENSVS